MTCVIGIDIGTTSTIGILLDTSKNKILKKISFHVDLFSYKEGWAEEDPNQWWLNTKKIILAIFYTTPAVLSNIGPTVICV